MLGTRVKALRKEQKVTQKELANAMGLSQQAVAKWEAGLSAPDPDMVRNLAQFFDTTTDDILGYEVKENSGKLTQHLQNIARAEHLIPVIGTVRAGYGALALEDDYGKEYAQVKDPENYFYLLVQGNSMAPRIHEGDLALVRKQQTLENGDLGVIIYGEGEGTLKKFIKKDGAVILQPFNPSYQEQVLTGEDLDHLFIAGKVVETKTKW